MLSLFRTAMFATLAVSFTAPILHAAPPAAAGASEQRALRAFAAAKKAGPLDLHAFLVRMPKGADLHMHLSGAIYAETFLKDAAADQLCIDPATLGFSRSAGKGAPCVNGLVPAANVFKDQHLYDQLIDSFSMRAFVPSAGVSGHDQFFATFGRFGGTAKDHAGEWLDEVATRAAAQNEQYLEIMNTPTLANAGRLAAGIAWPKSPAVLADYGQDITGTSTAELTKLREQLLAGGLRDDIATDQKDFATALASRNEIEHCGTPAATPACAVQIKFLFQILRQNVPQFVFAQTLLAFEVASTNPDVVGLNFVQPEDAYLAMSEYTRQMRMVEFLHGLYPTVHISLHAGEVVPGMVAPEGVRFHIRQAVDLGHAERIGHGVDVMYEDEPGKLLKELASRHVMVEINITSNDGILGVKPPFHPLPDYLAAHVPVALATDDEGVSRIDLTHEYVRAATEFNLGYLDLKTMARTSIEHSFLPGASLWAQPDVFTRAVSACAAGSPGSETPSAACLAFLKANTRAAQEWELEHRFKVFESSL